MEVLKHNTNIEGSQNGITPNIKWSQVNEMLQDETKWKQAGELERIMYVPFYPSLLTLFNFFHFLIFIFLVPLKSTLKNLTKMIFQLEKKSGKESKGKEERNLHLQSNRCWSVANSQPKTHGNGLYLFRNIKMTKGIQILLVNLTLMSHQVKQNLVHTKEVQPHMRFSMISLTRNTRS